MRSSPRSWGLATYPYKKYKEDVLAVLRTNFGTQAVTPANRAIKIADSNTRRSADVVVAAQFRSAGLVGETLGPQYEQGICFFANSDRIVNYPKQHSANCTGKHQRTNGWFKPTVRIFKNMRSRLVSTGAIPSGSAPSYFIEGLLYNVPAQRADVHPLKTIFQPFVIPLQHLDIGQEVMGEINRLLDLQT